MIWILWNKYKVIDGEGDIRDRVETQLHTKMSLLHLQGVVHLHTVLSWGKQDFSES